MLFLLIPCCRDNCNAFYVHILIFVGVIVKYGLRWWRWISACGWGEKFVYWYKLWLLISMVHDASSIYPLLQEDGSLPDREQVWFLSIIVNFIGLNWKVPVFNYNDVLLDELIVCHLQLVVSFLLLFCLNSALQDLKPRFHSSRLHGSDNAEDDVRCVDIFLLPIGSSQ